jgi:hypothetical protein
LPNFTIFTLPQRGHFTDTNAILTHYQPTPPHNISTYRSTNIEHHQNVVKNGKHQNNKQRLKCKQCGKTFQKKHSNHGAKPETRLLIVKMSLNGSGIRDISRVLNISPNTTLSVLKKQKTISRT